MPDPVALILITERKDFLFDAIATLRSTYPPRTPIVVLDKGIHPEATNRVLLQTHVQVICPDPTWQYKPDTIGWRKRPTIQSYSLKRFLAFAVNRLKYCGVFGTALVFEESLDSPFEVEVVS